MKYVRLHFIANNPCPKSCKSLRLLTSNVVVAIFCFIYFHAPLFSPAVSHIASPVPHITSPVPRTAQLTPCHPSQSTCRKPPPVRRRQLVSPCQPARSVNQSAVRVFSDSSFRSNNDSAADDSSVLTPTFDDLQEKLASIKLNASPDAQCEADQDSLIPNASAGNSQVSCKGKQTAVRSAGAMAPKRTARMRRVDTAASANKLKTNTKSQTPVAAASPSGTDVFVAAPTVKRTYTRRAAPATGAKTKSNTRVGKVEISKEDSTQLHKEIKCYEKDATKVTLPTHADLKASTRSRATTRSRKPSVGT